MLAVLLSMSFAVCRFAGIPAASLPQLFQPYTQLTPAVARQHGETAPVAWGVRALFRCLPQSTSSRAGCVLIVWLRRLAGTRFAVHPLSCAGGSGLGLSIVKSLVENMHGTSLVPCRSTRVLLSLDVGLHVCFAALLLRDALSLL